MLEELLECSPCCVLRTKLYLEVCEALKVVKNQLCKQSYLKRLTGFFFNILESQLIFNNFQIL